ncbi:hypothetical protein DY245_26610 [Streptomyces inhibens]|uniref:Uncharacterized protein n=1 Tax=Streptomyces inhibens TaxID=2293571 RepID=A0A371PYN5_STRIH|nr:hypothetical protein [Streptomyces inhibens]REK87461.1 hypothetical protein DY245_26610 [Streptomyces inhibens]
MTETSSNQPVSPGFSVPVVTVLSVFDVNQLCSNFGSTETGFAPSDKPTTVVSPVVAASP